MKTKTLKEKRKKTRQPCEIYSRCCGYMRPTKNFNDGKISEFKDRKTFIIQKTEHL